MVCKYNKKKVFVSGKKLPSTKDSPKKIVRKILGKK